MCQSKYNISGLKKIIHCWFNKAIVLDRLSSKIAKFTNYPIFIALCHENQSNMENKYISQTVDILILWLHCTSELYFNIEFLFSHIFRAK
jgi:hypothetical protein